MDFGSRMKLPTSRLGRAEDVSPTLPHYSDYGKGYIDHNTVNVEASRIFELRLGLSTLARIVLLTRRRRVQAEKTTSWQRQP